jgi:hypothetical protein
MAKAEFEVKVSLERCLHEAMGEFANQYYQEHGVMIDSIDFAWIKTIGGKNSVCQVSVETSTNES